MLTNQQRKDSPIKNGKRLRYFTRDVEKTNQFARKVLNTLSTNF